MIYLTSILSLFGILIIAGIIQTLNIERNEKAKRRTRGLQRCQRME